MVLIPPERTVAITVPLPPVPALSHPLWGVRVCSSVAFRRISAVLIAIPITQPNCSNVQGDPTSFVVLVSWKLLQSRTERSYLLLRPRHKKHSSNANRTPRGRPRHLLLQVLILLHHLQNIHIHFPSDCWLISYFFSAAHLLNTSMTMHNQRSSSKANRRAMSRPRCHHRRLSLPPPRRPRHLLFLILILSHQVQQARSHDPFHCGLKSSLFSAVYL
ncbi:hypothetical protein EV702DRAFT_357071 [Suillus placidus]|uniref:Uncharacterized protein n=1 Tax=Suillus placidus TaxID=48579 RepID=A0A9P6ZUV6_9AGAM|nr:hypothetical protein EV702DRAFT_357071 [Suillus placidus]